MKDDHDLWVATKRKRSLIQAAKECHPQGGCARLQRQSFIELVGGLVLDPGHAGGIPHLSWSGGCPGLLQEDLESVAEERDGFLHSVEVTRMDDGRSLCMKPS